MPTALDYTHSRALAPGAHSLKVSSNTILRGLLTLLFFPIQNHPISYSMCTYMTIGTKLACIQGLQGPSTSICGYLSTLGKPEAPAMRTQRLKDTTQLMRHKAEFCLSSSQQAV